MAGQIRPDKKLMKLVYKIMKTPKDLQQDNERVVSAKKQKEWFIDSLMSQ